RPTTFDIGPEGRSTAKVAACSITASRVSLVAAPAHVILPGEGALGPLAGCEGVLRGRRTVEWEGFGLPNAMEQANATNRSAGANDSELVDRLDSLEVGLKHARLRRRLVHHDEDAIVPHP